jgi:hypothetical protein
MIEQSQRIHRLDSSVILGRFPGVPRPRDAPSDALGEANGEPLIAEPLTANLVDAPLESFGALGDFAGSYFLPRHRQSESADKSTSLGRLRNRD